MTLVYYLCWLLLIVSLLFIGLVVLGFIISPKDPKTGKKVSRIRTLAVGMAASLVVMFVFGGIMSATEPNSVKTEREQEKILAAKLQKETADKERLKKIEASKPKVRVETKKDAIQFETIEKNDPTIPSGERRVATEGVNGERTITYEVTYVSAKETTRKEIKNEVTKAPIAKVILVGTYVKPKPAPVSTSSGGGYTNSQGNYVPSPSTNPAGATARCHDGTYSYSQSRRGTCSHHGGVAQWL
jgi:hypothetical protein